MEYPYNISPFQLSPHEASSYYSTQSPEGDTAFSDQKLSHAHYTAPVPLSYALGPYGRGQSAYDAVLTPGGNIMARTSSDAARGTRRESSTQDKDSESLQSLRRREQNRAAQRAFRERQNQRVAELEVQLQGLSTKHVGLRQSYEREADKVASMKRKIEDLKAEIESLSSFSDGDAVFGRPRMPDRFDAVSGPEMPLCNPFLGFDLDLNRQLLDAHADFFMSDIDYRL